MKLYMIFVVAVTCVSLASIAADEPKPNNKLLGTATAEFYWDASSYGKCQQAVTEKYTRFALHNGGNELSDKQFLIRQDFEVGTGCFEGYYPAKIAVSASAVQLSKDGATVSPTMLWRFEETGNAGRIGEYPLQNIYQITLGGCCGSPDENKYYSLLTGRLVAPAVLTTLELADTRALRFISVGFSCAKGKTAQAILYYSDENGINQKLPLKYPLEGCSWRTEEIHITPGEKEHLGTVIFNQRNFDGITVTVRLCRDTCADTSLEFAATIDADVMKIARIGPARKPHKQQGAGRD